MWAFIIRRILWTIPIVLGIVLITFILFRLVAPDPARQQAGKFATPQQLEAIRHQLGRDKPRWINRKAAHERGIGGFFDAQLFDILAFRFPPSIKYQDSVWSLFARKAPVSLAIQLPAFVILLGFELLLALLVAANRGRWPDVLVTFLAVLGMSVPALSIYMAAQWLFGAHWQIFPVAGWETWPYWIRFAILPILVSIFAGLGGGVRFYRTVVLEEINSDYIRTARAKGLPKKEVYLTHLMRNLAIPVITNTIVALPGLLLGSLLLERLFQIPGFGGLTVEAIFNGDEPVVTAVVYVTSIVYCVMLLLTDILYAIADPRVSLK